MWLRLWGCHGICFTVSVKVSLFLSFTRVYIRNLFPKKLFTRSQTVRFLLIFIASNCEGLGISSLHTASQAFTPALALRHVRWSVWRVESENLHTVSWWKPQENGLPVNVWMLFSGIIYVYRCAREALMCRATASYSSICFRKYSSEVFLLFVLGTFSDVKWYSCFPRFLVM